LENDLAALRARKQSFRDDKNAGKYSAYYDATDEKESESSKEIKEGSDAAAFAAGVAASYKTESEKEAEAKKAQAEMKKVMDSSISSYKNYNTADLNMIRAQKALEKARASGNVEAIYGAEQQVAGARQAAEVAGRYKSQFALYGADGKQLNITDDKGKYLSDAEIRKQAGGEYTGAFTYYNQETGQMDAKAMGYKEARDYLSKITSL
jgi:hypothetical protein